MKKYWIVGATVSLWLALVGAAWVIGTAQAKKRTEATLDYAVSDIRLSIDGAIDMVLDHVARTCVRHLGKADLRSREEISLVAELFDIDELNVVDRTGLIISTNDPDCLGVDMTIKEETRAFLELTNGTTRVVSQPFRRHAYNNSRRKYLGVPFPGGDGYVQVGMDESRMAKMIDAQFAYLFDSEMGETASYLCADSKTGEIKSKYLEPGEKPTLEGIGFDESSAGDSGETFEQILYGKKAYCRSFPFAGHRILIVDPESEFFGTRDVIVEAIAVLLALVLGAFAVLLIRISGDSARIKEFYRKEELARAKEMDIAKTIQTSALPADIPDIPYAMLSASMTPARDVGGDFYDYFMLDSSHGAFLVADVSGKGITAALYMMTAKTLIKDTILAERDLESAMTKVNIDLSRNNPANMFLTAWVGVIDFETGVIEYVNAGHNPPVKLLEGGKVEWIGGKSGPMLAFMEGVGYKAHTIKLAPGEAIFLYTDGVTEAMDLKGELFGDGRLEATLACLKSHDPEKVCSLVRAAVAAFSAGASASDDLTVLAVEYLARPNRFVRSFAPTQAGILAASGYLDESIGAKVSGEVACALHVVLDEIASNIVKHSGASGFEVDIEYLENPPRIKLVFIDDGEAYNPLAHADPDTTLPAKARPIGGLGIMMVKKIASSLSYIRSLNRNILSVLKDIKV